jgi:hypothetical protein
LDVKGLGGYIVVPPSIHPETGEPYVWDEDDHPLKIRPAPAPEWLLIMVAERPHLGTTVQGHSPNEWADLILPAKEGSRNQRLTQLAGLLFRNLPGAVAWDLGWLWATHRTTPPLPEAEVRRTLINISAKERSRRSS